MTQTLDKELKTLMRGQAVDAGPFVWGKNDNLGTRMAANLSTYTRLTPDEPQLEQILKYVQDLLFAYGYKTDNRYSVPPGGLNEEVTASLNAVNFASSDGQDDSLINADLSSLGQIAKVTIKGFIRAPSTDRVYSSLNSAGTGQFWITPAVANEWQPFQTGISFLTMDAVQLGKSTNIFSVSSYFQADWADFQLINTNTGAILGRWKLNEQGSGVLDAVPTLDSSGNGFDGVHEGGTGGNEIIPGLSPLLKGFSFVDYTSSVLDSVKNDPQLIQLMLERGFLEDFNNAKNDRARLAAVFATLAE